MSRHVESTSESPWRSLIAASTATAALTAPAITASAPVAGSGISGVDHYPLCRLIFAGTDSANETINYQVILWYRFAEGSEAYIPLIVAKGVATLGAATVGANGTAIGVAGTLIADTITETVGQLGVYVYSPANDTVARLDINTKNAAYIEVQTDVDTAATATVLLMRGEAAGSFSEIDVTGTGLATEVTSTAILAKLIAAPATEAQIGATANPAAGTVNKQLADMLSAEQKATATAASVLYDGAANADKRLAVNVTTSAIPANAAVIATGANNVLEVFAQDATAAETLTLSVAEYSGAVPSLATLQRQISVALGGDLGRTVDRASVGLVTGTEHYAKTPVRVAVSPGAYVVLCIKENATGPVYARYQLRGSV